MNPKCEKILDMGVHNVCHMNKGDGETSYSRNSSLQENVILRVRPILAEAIMKHSRRRRRGRGHSLFLEQPHRCFHIADFGCSSGSNTFLAISGVIDTIVELCRLRGQPVPEFHVALNDLADNDFNSVVSLPLSNFYDELGRKGVEPSSCFVSCVPGSFYGRLFPTKTLHFVHSSYSLHWLSKVPDGIGNNKGNIHIGKTSPPNVFDAYLSRFQCDFSTFLSCRDDEMVDGGHMFLTLSGRSTPHPTGRECFLLWHLLSASLLDMAKEGLVDEAEVDSFNVPVYTPHEQEVKDIVKKQGSFNLDKLETFETNWDPYHDHGRDHDHDQFHADRHESGQRVARIIRAICEPMVERHFGSRVVDDLFTRFAKYVAEADMEKTKFVHLVVSLSKKK